MKRIIIYALITIIVTPFVVSCKRFETYPTGFRNNADYGITVYSILIPPYDYSHCILFPDTSLPSQKPLQMVKIAPNDYVVTNEVSCLNVAELYGTFHTDTISFFVFSTDTLEKYGWDSVQKAYNILQRYDIGVDDYKLLEPNYPTFPPTEKMRNIKMWPPYGTYDALGHRRE